MKSFVLTIPKSISQIENHYFCKCGKKFVNKNKCPKCGNAEFFSYEDVKNYKPIIYEYDIKEIYHFKDLTFKLPFNSEELIYWSDKLKNCLSSYTNIHNKRYLIFGVFKKNELTYALNFDKEKKYIVEAKGFANSLVPEEDMVKIEEFIKELNI